MNENERNAPRWGPGGTPSNKLDMYVRRQGVGLLSRFGFKYGIDLSVQVWNNIIMDNNNNNGIWYGFYKKLLFYCYNLLRSANIEQKEVEV